MAFTPHSPFVLTSWYQETHLALEEGDLSTLGRGSMPDSITNSWQGTIKKRTHLMLGIAMNKPTAMTKLQDKTFNLYKTGVYHDTPSSSALQSFRISCRYSITYMESKISALCVALFYYNRRYRNLGLGPPIALKPALENTTSTQSLASCGAPHAYSLGRPRCTPAKGHSATIVTGWYFVLWGLLYSRNS